MKKLIISTCTGLLAFGIVLSAHAFTATNTGSATTGTLASGVVTSADLGVTEVGTLPTSHLYFFKEWSRGLSRMFTWNALASTELALNIANEKAAEMIEVEIADPKDTHGIQQAIENLARSTEKLNIRLSLLKDDSKNPKVAKLLEKIDEVTTKHLTALNQISERQHLKATATMSDGTNENLNKTEKYKDDDCDGDCAGIDSAIKEAETKSNVTLIATTEKDADMKQKAADQIARAQVAINDAEMRMKAGLDTAGGMLGNGASVVGGLVPGGAVISSAVSSVSQLGGHGSPGGGAGAAAYAKTGVVVDGSGASSTGIAIGDPGVNGNRAINTKGTGAVAKSATLVVSGTPGGTVESKTGVSTNPPVVSTPGTTDHAINTKGTGTAGKTLPSTDVHADNAIFFGKKGYDYYRTATNKLLSAKEAFASGKYGEAFGQARGAEVIAIESARMSMNMTIERQTPKRDFGDRAPASTTPAVKNPVEKAEAPIHATTETGIQKDVIKVSPPSLPRSIPENSIEVMPAPSEAVASSHETDKSVVCTADYSPVCGVDGKTYSNACQANASRVSISYTGECKASGTSSDGATPVSTKALQ